MGLSSVSARGGMELFISLWHELSVETSGGEAVSWLVQGALVENFTGLLSDSLLQMVVVDSETWNVALITWDDSGLLLDWDLNKYEESDRNKY